MTNTQERSAHEVRDRRGEFRRLMIATVDASAPVPRRGKVLFGTVAAAVFLIGALTGGAVVASGKGFTSEPGSWWAAPTTRDAVLQSVSGGELVGTSKVVTHTGTVIINLGTQPRGANVVAVSIPCQQKGRGIILIDGGNSAKSTYRCSTANRLVSKLYTMAPDVSHRLTVTTSQGAPLVVTWAWATSAESSQLLKLQQQELQGQLTQTQQEYNKGIAECASGALSGIACPTAPPSPSR